ncbi:hypothetical protein [Glycomyces dulcitolivorans]|uniref:hypothetical protein n=1 Tax=Glycomyces dulcitolivorans TaxID=2200759 RepID=UPI000DD2FC14|nr:hypothetical protein [Glycomyces dulcitolivorans]
MRRRIASVIGMLAASFAIVMLTGTAASAATTYARDIDWNTDPKACFTAVTGITYSKVNGCYEDDGDLIWVADKSADGYGTAVYWSNLAEGTSGKCVHALGAAKGWAVCGSMDWTEGDTIVWTVGWDSANGWVRSTQDIYSNA